MFYIVITWTLSIFFRGVYDVEPNNVVPPLPLWRPWRLLAGQRQGQEVELRMAGVLEATCPPLPSGHVRVSSRWFI